MERGEFDDRDSFQNVETIPLLQLCQHLKLNIKVRVRLSYKKVLEIEVHLEQSQAAKEVKEISGEDPEASSSPAIKCHL